MHTINVYLPDVSILMPVIQTVFVLVISAAIIKLIERWIPFFGS